MKSKNKPIIIVVIMIATILLFIIVLLSIIINIPNKNKPCYYDLGENITCKQMGSGYETRFFDCSDGYIHIGNKYKRICS